MKRALILSLISVFLTACGGGGGGGGGGGDGDGDGGNNLDTILNNFNPANFGQIAVTTSNAAAMLSSGDSSTSSIIEVNLLISDAIERFTAANMQPSSMECYDGGSLEIEGISNNELEVRFNNCKFGQYEAGFNGALLIAADEFYGLHPEEQAFKGTVQFPARFNLGDGRVVAGGSYDYTYQKSFNGKTVTATIKGDQFIRLANASGAYNLANGTVEFQRDYDFSVMSGAVESHVIYDLDIVSSQLAGKFRCNTRFPLTSQGARFPNGIGLQCASAGTSIAQANENPGAFGANPRVSVVDITTGASVVSGDIRLAMPIHNYGMNSVPAQSFQPILQTLNGLRIAVESNDAVYSNYSQTLLTSVSAGNRLVEIDPISGATQRTLALAGEPGVLAISADGQVLYIGLRDRSEVLVVNVATFAVVDTLELAPVTDFFVEYSLLAGDIAVSPLNNQLVAISQFRHREGIPDRVYYRISLFMNGSELPNTFEHMNTPHYIEFDRSGGLLYGNYDLSTGVKQLQLDFNNQGFTTANWRENFDYGFGDLIADGDRVLTSAGRLFNFSTGEVYGRYQPAYEYYRTAKATLANQATGQVLRFNNILEVFDRDSFTFSNAYYVDIAGEVRELIQVGISLFAVVSNEEIVLLTFDQLQDSGWECNTGLYPWDIPSAITAQLNCDFADAVFDAGRSKIYASVRGFSGRNGNSIAVINSNDFSIEQYIHAGSEPAHIAMSGDSSTLYVGFTGANKIARISLNQLEVQDEFSTGHTVRDGPLYAGDIEVFPNNPDNAAVVLETQSADPAFVQLSAFVNGVQAPDSFYRVGGNTVGEIAFAGQNRLLAYNNLSDGFELMNMGVNTQGVHLNASYRDLFSGFSTDFDYSNALAVSSVGEVVDTTNMTLLGRLRDEASDSNPQGKQVLIDRANNLIFIYGNLVFEGRDPVIQAYDLNTHQFVGEYQLPMMAGGMAEPVALLDLDVARLAVVLESRMYMIQKSLVTD